MGSGDCLIDCKFRSDVGGSNGSAKTTDHVCVNYGRRSANADRGSGDSRAIRSEPQGSDDATDGYHNDGAELRKRRVSIYLRWHDLSALLANANARP